MSTCILSEVGGLVSEGGCKSVVVQQNGQMGASWCCCAAAAAGQIEKPRTYFFGASILFLYDT